MKSTKLLIVVCCFMTVTACGGGKGNDNNNNAGGVAPPTPTPNTVAEAIAQGEKSGALPTLNRDDTVAGVDADKNGIRDDIDQYIAKLPDTAEQKMALQQKARAIQATLLLDATDKLVLREAARKISAANRCSSSKYTDRPALHQRRRDLEKYTVNTKARFDAYEKFNSGLSGSSYQSPTGDTCEK